MMNRRHFLSILASLGLTPGLKIAATSEVPLVAPDVIGQLDAVVKDRLWQVFQQIGKIWNNSELVFLSRTDFDAVLDAKTGEPPSYLTRYKAFARHLQDLERAHGPDRAFHQVFFEEPQTAGHACVVAEFIELQLIYGGFRKFGWKNFKGFQGGPFGGAYHPYRTMGEQ